MGYFMTKFEIEEQMEALGFSRNSGSYIDYEEAKKKLHTSFLSDEYKIVCDLIADYLGV